MNTSWLHAILSVLEFLFTIVWFAVMMALVFGLIVLSRGMP